VKAVGQKFPRWRNLAAAVFLLIATTQISWGILDSQGLAKYGASGWPYELNPAANWITAGIFLLPGLWCLSGGPSVSRACALGLALGLICKSSSKAKGLCSLTASAPKGAQACRRIAPRRNIQGLEVIEFPPVVLKEKTSDPA
jgi:hypothetical protein